MSGAKSGFSNGSKDQLMRDFQSIITDAETLLKATANQGREAIGAIRAQTEKSLAIAKVKMTEAENALKEKARVTANATDDYVHENPWRVVSAAAAVGLVIGLLIGRR